jgi:hypothetical protein
MVLIATKSISNNWFLSNIFAPLISFGIQKFIFFMKRKFSWILTCSLLFLAGSVLAQDFTDPYASDDDEILRRRRGKDKVWYEDGVIYENTGDKGFSIVAYESIRLYKKPGRDAKQVGIALFTEELKHLGVEGYIRDESRNYIYVRTSGGKKGWVQGNYVVRDGGVVVITKDAPVYENPNTLGSIKKEKFQAGDLVILDDFQDGWVHLTSQRKAKVGWVEGYDNLSLEDADIEAAALFAEALKIESNDTRRNALRTITQGRGQDISPEMALVIEDAIRRTEPNYVPPSSPKPDDYPYYANGEDGLSQGGGSLGDLGEGPSRGQGQQTQDNVIPVQIDMPAEMKYNVYVEKVVDRETGQYYNRVIESGGIQPVKAKNPPSIYYAYHKTLPIGSTILLEVPGTGSYVQLEIIARLRADNPNIVGLGGELIKKVYGEIAAKNVFSATILYPQY